jgi:ABC-2 type transport system ATP-binding protein
MMEPTDAAVRTVMELRGVRKRYGDVEALRGVDFHLRTGEQVALLGPNGAGKTTAVSILLGLRRPDAGSARLFGQNPVLPSARRSIGVTPQETGFPDGLTVGEVVDLVRAHYPNPIATGRLLERFGLSAMARRRAGKLSGGEARRLAVALAFAGRPRAVVLDEPTTGLDVESRLAVWGVLRDFVTGGGSVLLTTHYLEEAQVLASRVVLISDATITAQGSVEEITSQAGLSRVRLRALTLPDLPAVSRVESTDGLHTPYTSDPDAVVRALVLKGVPFTDLHIERASLEEAFLSLTGSRS